MNGDVVIRIRPLENGYTVEVPDWDEIEKRKAAAKKNKSPSGSVIEPYCGDCTETFIAKSTGEVMKLVKDALAQLPDALYADAFEDAAKAAPKGM